MDLWLVRAGKYGEREQLALDNGLVTIGWDDMPDLKSFPSRDELASYYRKNNPTFSNITIGSHVGQLWRFANDIKIGDLVGLPSKHTSVIHIGKVKGEYHFDKKFFPAIHYIPVEWLKEIPRPDFDQDLLYSFGSLLTVSNISRNDAVSRIQAMLSGKSTKSIKKVETSPDGAYTNIVEEELDIEEYATDQIAKVIERQFKGHGFARLIDEILKAQGYRTYLSDPGPDGGKDILVGAGDFGFLEPRICVQVKSTDKLVDMNVYNQTVGVMKKVNAENVIIVSWSGFDKRVLNEAKNDFFRVRLWSSKEVLQYVFLYYEKFSDEMKAEMPLKRVWTLVQE